MPVRLQYAQAFLFYPMVNDPLYFMGIMPPVDIQHEITLTKEYFRDTYGASHALKSPPHITLVPPFRLPVSGEKDLIHNLKSFAAAEEAFSIQLENFNAFPPRVIFVDVKPAEKLNGLYERITGFAAGALGHSVGSKGNRHFSPHVTVAFKDLRKEDFNDAWPEFRNKKINFEFVADRITLFKHNGRKWEILYQAGFATHPE